MRRLKPAAPRRELLKIDGRAVEVKLRLNPRARRVIVKVHPNTGEVTVTAPTRTGLAHALNFARTETAWIARQLAGVPRPVALAPGSAIPFRGALHQVRHAPERDPEKCAAVFRPARVARNLDKGAHLRPGSARPNIEGTVPVWRNESAREIWVSGRAEHAPRRLIDFLKAEARKLFEIRALEFGAHLGVAPARIAVRDTASRWGSCSSARSLSFSWRLILAPDFVLDYVVAHEVAHLREMNHGPRFWAHVKTLVGEPGPPQRWLRTNGRDLQRYGAQ